MQELTITFTQDQLDAIAKAIADMDFPDAPNIPVLYAVPMDDFDFGKYMFEAGVLFIEKKFPQSDVDQHIKSVIRQWHRWQKNGNG